MITDFHPQSFYLGAGVFCMLWVAGRILWGKAVVRQQNAQLRQLKSRRHALTEVKTTRVWLDGKRRHATHFTEDQA